jgi:hypothetical protein
VHKAVPEHSPKTNLPITLSKLHKVVEIPLSRKLGLQTVYTKAIWGAGERALNADPQNRVSKILVEYSWL